MRSGSRQHRGEAGGGGFGFPPLLATNGRIHKGDCDMRTGAIFARGSCRALKWMAVFGVVFALGAGQAAAQAPAFSSTATDHEFNPGTTTITLTMDQLVYGSPPASLFTVMVDADGAGAGTAAANAVTAVSPIPQSSPSDKVTLTVTTVIKSGSTVTVAYDAPATATAAQLKASDDDAAVEDATAFTVTEGESIPSLPDVEDMKLVLDERVTAITLPDATGGNGALTYTLNLEASTATGVNAHQITTAAPDAGTSADTGLRFLADPPTVLGTPSLAGVHNLRYAVTDAAVGNGTANTISQTFKITVEATPTPTTGDKGQITKFELVGGSVSEKTIAGTKRYHVPEGAQDVELAVTVQWLHSEIAAIGYDTEQMIEVGIMSDRTMTLPNWLSWIDEEGDVHFPRSGTFGRLMGAVKVKTPKMSEVPAAERGSGRHTKAKTGKLALLILHDNHEAENDAFYIMATGGDVDLDATAAQNKITPEVVIEDDEEQKVTVKMGTRTSSTVYEGDSGDDLPEFTVAASPARVDLPLEVRLDMLDLAGVTVSSAEISVSRSSMTLMDGTTGNSDTVTVHLPASDGNRVDNDYELQASVNVYSVASGGYQTIPVASHPIKVVDRHKLPTLMVSPATATVAEGGMVELTLMINRNPANTTVSSTEKLQYTQEEVTVMLSMGAGSTAGMSDYSIMTNPVTFPERTSGAYTAEMKVTVEATADDELDDMEMLVLDAMVAGSKAANGTDKAMHAGVSSLTIEEGTMKYVWAKTQEEVEAAIYAAKEAGAGDDMTFAAGEMIEVMGSALFSAAEGVTLSYTAASDMSDVASASVNGGTVMVTAAAEGMAHITITAHASMPSGVKILDQSDPRSASVKFPVEVGLEALSIMLSGPEDENIVEGGMGAMVTATANRAVTADTKVMLMRDRAASSADDMDYTAEPITIMAGQMSGSTMVMATADEMMENEGNMPEELVLYGMTEGMAGEVTGEVHLHIWDAAVPALPVIAQLLLAALLGLGGYRRYLRRR